MVWDSAVLSSRISRCQDLSKEPSSSASEELSLPLNVHACQEILCSGTNPMSNVHF